MKKFSVLSDAELEGMVVADAWGPADDAEDAD
jgi:hypothetical protein